MDEPDYLNPDHLNSHHRQTMVQIFQHPLSHNIEWHAVLSLLEAIGTVEETSKGHLLVKVGSATETFESEGDKDIDADDLENLRGLLREAGYAPDGNPA